MALLKIKPLLVALSLVIANVSTRAVADDALPAPILPDNLHWIDAPSQHNSCLTYAINISSN